MRATRMLVALALFTACAKTEQAATTGASAGADVAADKAQIEANSAKLTRFLSAGQPDSAAAMFTDDYRWMPPNGPAGSGRDAWVTWSKGFAVGSLVNVATIDRIDVSGDLAVEAGHFVMTITPGPSAPKGAKVTVDTGKYMWQWHKVGGTWRLAASAWNSSIAPKQ